MGTANAFNRSRFGRWINSRPGRVFKAVAGASFVTVGIALWGSPWGYAALAWSVLPVTAAAFDVCWISAALGGPLRARQCLAAGAGEGTSVGQR